MANSRQDRQSGLSLTEVARVAGATVPDPGWATVLVQGVTLDSRRVRPGELYAGLPGANVHGARFAVDAAGLGAAALLTDAAGAEIARTAGVDLPVLVVADPRAVLGLVADAVYGHPSARLSMVGITGTNGKTTCAYLVESALRALGQRTGLIGTVETRIGDERVTSERTTPESPDVHALLGRMVQAGVDTCVMEVSSHALRLHRVDGVVYDVALFTNLSQDHLDFHSSMQDYFEAKASLFTPERARRGVVCVDDEWGRQLATTAAIEVTTVASRGGDADWLVLPQEGLDAGAEAPFELRSRDGLTVLRLVSFLPGDFNIVNTAMAALALLALGVSAPDVESACQTRPVVPGRMELVVVPGVTAPRCVVDFAHTADAVDAALAALRTSTTGRLIAVLGAGGDRDRGKRPAMGAAAAARADIVVVTDDNPRSEPPEQIRAAVLEGARACGSGARLIDGGDRASAIDLAVRLGADGADGAPPDQLDTVAVLGKGHETGQEVAGLTSHFDDREQLERALDRLRPTLGGHA